MRTMKLINMSRSETGHFIGGLILGIMLTGAGAVISQLKATEHSPSTSASGFAVEGTGLLATLSHGTFTDYELATLSHGTFTDYDWKTKTVAQYRAIRVDDTGYVICSAKGK